MEIIIKPNKSFTFDLKEILNHRELLYFFSLRDIKVRYSQTLLGIFWAVIQPILAMVIFVFLFGRSFSKTTQQIPYAIFVLSGLIFWNYFSSSLSSVSASLYDNRSIITKVFFPRVIISVSAALVPVVDFFFSFLLFVVLSLVLHLKITILSIVIVPLLLISSFLVVLSVGIGLSIINVKYRDVQYALPFFVQLLLFLTPIIYPISVLPTNLRLLIYINPMTSIISIYRAVLLGNFSMIDVSGIFISIASAMLFFVISLALFKRYDIEISDIL